MKKILVAFAFVVWGAFGATVASATCADGYFEYGADCIESKFEITTISMSAGDVFEFSMTAIGTFYVDWGDQVQEFIRTDTTPTSYSHEFATGGVKTIRFGGLATGYSATEVPAISFKENTFIQILSGSLGAIFPTLGATIGYQPRFHETFIRCTNLKQIPSTLFNGVTGSISKMFSFAFAYDSNLESIPAGLFNGVTGGASGMFNATFVNCAKIPAIPSGLFDGITSPENAMFRQTFQNCYGLTRLPDGLFRNITGGGGNMVFFMTFYNCKNITGYVPTNFFGSNLSTNNNNMHQVFDNTKLYTTCPCGTHQYTTGYESVWNSKVSCTVGLKPNEHWYNGRCSAICDAGITWLKTSTGLSLLLVAEKVTTPSIHISYNDKICYVPLMAGNANNAVNLAWAGNTYHTFLPDDITPNGFTGQPE